MIESKNSEIEKVVNFFQEKEYKSSINLANNILLDDPSNLFVQNILALSLKNIGKRQEAIDLLSSIIRDHPKEGYLYSNLGNIFLSDGKLNEALKYFKLAIKYNPELENAFNGLGAALTELGKLEEALEIYKQALNITKNPKNLHYNIANIYRKLDIYDKAASHYSKTDVLLSSSHHLECLYLMDKKEDFIINLEKLEKEEVLTSLVSSLSTHSRIRYELDKKYSFCDNPFSYVYSRNLIKDKVISNKNIDNFNNEVNSLNLDFKDQALLNGGNQSAGNIFLYENKNITNIKKIITDEINLYRNNFKDSLDKYISSWPDDTQLFGWIIKIHSGGNLDAHIHKEGWLSGSLYLEIPEDKGVGEGDIIFSLTGANYPTNNKLFPQKRLSLSKGLVVLFPSALFHYTTPFKSKTNRITLAFDVIPSSNLG